MKFRKIEGARNILIRGTNWVGDSVIAVPAMREIRRLFPEAKISLLVRPWVRDIYAAAEFVDEVLDYDKGGAHRGLSGLMRLVYDLKRRRFDLAILLQNAFEAAWIAWSARIPIRIGYARDGRGWLLTHACRIDPAVRDLHQAYYYLGILAGAGLLEDRPWERADQPLRAGLRVREADRLAAEGILRSAGVRPGDIVIGLNPGAYYGEAKRWFPDRYARAADALAEQYRARVLIFGSAADRRVADEVAAKMARPSVVLAGRTTLGELMGLIRECSLLITNDSGPMHLAAALDVPQLAIFGSTSEVATGPLSPQATVLKQPADCSPCFLRRCPTDFRCMTRITVEQVVEAARKKLDGQIRGRT